MGNPDFEDPVKDLEYELIAEEVMRMLVGSIGLVLVAPLASFMAAYAFTKYEPILKSK